ncbi:HIT family protein [Candidatus Woesearchaeota archaeon]|nr:HIT family protein [Candidatus Woesearchaeota archaeon]
MCEVCELAKSGKLLYSDDYVVAAMHPKPTVKGHVLVFAKEHHQIITQVPQAVLSQLFDKAKMMAGFVFDALQAEGTNIIAPNGTIAGQTDAHFAMHVLPRFANDGLNFDWQPKQYPEEKLDELLGLLNEVQVGEESFADQEIILDTEPKEVSSTVPPDKNYQLKHLRRIP